MKAILDIETGGFSITKNGICEIAVLIINDQLEIVHEQSWIIAPYTRPDSEELVSYKEDAMAVNGISMEEIENGVDVKSVVMEIINLFCTYGVSVLIGHNLRKFDLPRIQYLFERFWECMVLNSFDIEDTLELCREQLSLDCNKLTSLCDHFGIDHTDKHRAPGDCRATLEVYKKLKGHPEPLPLKYEF